MKESSTKVLDGFRVFLSLAFEHDLYERHLYVDLLQPLHDIHGCERGLVLNISVESISNKTRGAERAIALGFAAAFPV
ncbi:hypothetical protein BD309DRAFT_1023636 [Dichomitus squalens]|uniref:Uncharacterized protein n=1 Tax=Dichomitus squalens TaxID=114155 RepID=A0A4Q9N9A4_9APHY|nr:hypothetical protein BD309DRAFT_1023636 [Dichomitus squalens]TBU58250.1 hypothetical protein BD310DRAFT_977544 [Dichomitus squalens]